MTPGWIFVIIDDFNLFSPDKRVCGQVLRAALVFSPLKMSWMVQWQLGLYWFTVMSEIYRLKASELDSNFLAKIKSQFGDKEIEIFVSEFEDETEYLLKSEENKSRLLRAIDNVDKNQNLVEVTFDD